MEHGDWKLELSNPAFPGYVFEFSRYEGDSLHVMARDSLGAEIGGWNIDLEYGELIDLISS